MGKEENITGVLVVLLFSSVNVSFAASIWPIDPCQEGVHATDSGASRSVMAYAAYF